jgi:hypothetical protein
MMEPYNIPKEQFSDLISAQKHGITRAVQVYSDNMAKELKCVFNYSSDEEHFLTRHRNIKQLTQNDMHFGYFAQVMKPTYEEAGQVSGKKLCVASVTSSILTDSRKGLQEQRDDNVRRLCQQERSRISIHQNG